MLLIIIIVLLVVELIVIGVIYFRTNDLRQGMIVGYAIALGIGIIFHEITKIEMTYNGEYTWEGTLTQYESFIYSLRYFAIALIAFGIVGIVVLFFQQLAFTQNDRTDVCGRSKTGQVPKPANQGSSQWECENCHSQNFPSTSACVMCGQARDQVGAWDNATVVLSDGRMICPECGTLHENEKRFCTECGAKLTE